jgi:hypothetical protein
MVKHPALFYAKYLLSKRSHPFQAIVAMLELLDLAGLDEDDLGRIEQALKFPIPYCPGSKDHVPTQTFLRKEGIWDAWHGEQDMIRTRAILGEPELRQAMESMILAPVSQEAGLRRLQMRFGDSVSPAAYHLFEHYFWNRSVMSALDWGQFVSRRQTSNQTWLKLALDAKDTGSLRLLLWKMGLTDLRRVEGNKIFTDLRNLSYMFEPSWPMSGPRVWLRRESMQQRMRPRT